MAMRRPNVAPENHLVALEVVIFPNSMRGTGEGHYPWSVPATVAAADRHQAVSSNGQPVQATMTNGTVVSTSSSAAAPPVQGAMTNGTVTASASSTGGEELTISYGKAGKVQILVPSDVPVVRLEPAQQSVVKPGAKAFVVATTSPGAHPSANFVAIGQNGMMPPM
jgi:hypothetical protein